MMSETATPAQKKEEHPDQPVESVDVLQLLLVFLTMYMWIGIDLAAAFPALVAALLAVIEKDRRPLRFTEAFLYLAFVGVVIARAIEIISSGNLAIVDEPTNLQWLGFAFLVLSLFVNGFPILEKTVGKWFYGKH